MANARRRRTQRTDDDDFEIDLALALQRLLPNGQVAEGDRWFFHTDGAFLVITRSRAQATRDPDEPVQ